MLGNLIVKKAKGQALNLEEFYSAVDYMLKHGADDNAIKFCLALNSFGMSKKEVLYLTEAVRDSGRTITYNLPILEKHSTGGIGDGTSIVLIPLIASMGYKIVKNTAKSFVFTNGSADRFGAIPNFKVVLTDEEIRKVLDDTNACVISNDGDICPADKILFKIREENGLENDLNLLAVSIASKKLASGAKAVLVDVKYGPASIVRTYRDAKKLSKLLKFVFKKSNVKSTIIVTDTLQTIGEGIGNALEVADALNVLQGKKTVMRDISVKYAYEMIRLIDPNKKGKDLYDQLYACIDNGDAYRKFMAIVKKQCGDEKTVAEAKIFKPYRSANFLASSSGYVACINSLLLGELTRRLCAENHDSNIGVVLHVKVGDYVNKGDVIVNFYYKEESDFEQYNHAIAKCVLITDEKIKPCKIIRKIYR